MVCVLLVILNSLIPMFSTDQAAEGEADEEQAAHGPGTATTATVTAAARWTVTGKAGHAASVGRRRGRASAIADRPCPIPTQDGVACICCAFVVHAVAAIERGIDIGVATGHIDQQIAIGSGTQGDIPKTTLGEIHTAQVQGRECVEPGAIGPSILEIDSLAGVEWRKGCQAEAAQPGSAEGDPLRGVQLRKADEFHAAMPGEGEVISNGGIEQRKAGQAFASFPRRREIPSCCGINLGKAGQT